MIATCSLIAHKTTRTADDSDYDYLDDDDPDENRKPADIFWGDVLDEELNDNNGSDGSRRRNCSTDTAIIDKLLNGTGYNKFRLPSKYLFLINKLWKYKCGSLKFKKKKERSLKAKYFSGILKRSINLL